MAHRKFGKHLLQVANLNKRRKLCAQKKIKVLGDYRDYRATRLKSAPKRQRDTVAEDVEKEHEM
jgi:hypothetical protein